MIVLPTGSGKSLVAADLVKTLYKQGFLKILVITHKKELVAQNVQEAEAHIADMSFKPSIGVYCAGLNRKQHQADIVFGTIQSVHKKAELFNLVDLIMVDEAHLISRTSHTMYRNFFEELDKVAIPVPVLGLTATPYRLEGGKTNPLIGGKQALFNQIVHEADTDDLIQRGYLTRIVTTDVTETDVTGVAVARGDFKRGELEDVVSIPEVVRRNVDETIKHGTYRKCWLIFTCGVKHAEAVQRAFKERGYDLPVITAETDDAERDRVLSQLKQSTIQGAINVEVMTTGFDASGIDLLSVMRPTHSKALIVQILGRGMRLHDGKENCLFLDFGGNIQRLGTKYGLPFEIGTDIEEKQWTCSSVELDGIDVLKGCGHVNPASKRKCESCGAVRPAGYGPMKECQECGAIVSVSARHCPECNSLFLKLDGKPSNIIWRADFEKGAWTDEWLRVHKFKVWAQTTSSGRNMLAVLVTFDRGVTEFYTYMPEIKTGPIRGKFNRLHEMLSIHPSIRRPETAKECSTLIHLGHWKTPTGIIPKKDSDGFLYIHNARFDVENNA